MTVELQMHNAAIRMDSVCDLIEHTVEEYGIPIGEIQCGFKKNVSYYIVNCLLEHNEVLALCMFEAGKHWGLNEDMILFGYDENAVARQIVMI